MSQVLSDAQKEPTTKSPTLTVRTADPISCTTPTYSWPITWCSTGSTPRYGHRSLPQMQVTVSRMIASVGSTILGSSRSSTRTSPRPYMTTPRIVLHSIHGFDQAGTSPAGGPEGALTAASEHAARGGEESLWRGVLTGNPRSRSRRVGAL